jgi:hypothetical protein
MLPLLVAATVWRAHLLQQELAAWCEAEPSTQHARCNEQLAEIFSVSPAEAARSSLYAQGHQDTVPSPQSWARCEFCAYSGGKAVLFDPDHLHAKVLGNADISSAFSFVASDSRWSTFFRPGSDRPAFVQGKMPIQVLPQPHWHWRGGGLVETQKCLHSVAVDTFVFTALTLHTGHLIVDVLEPLFNMQFRQRGAVNKDTLLVFDVANPEEQAWMHKRIIQWAQKDDTIFRTLRLFTRFPIFTKQALDTLPGTTCFRSLNLGLDIAGSYTEVGYSARLMLDGR